MTAHHKNYCLPTEWRLPACWSWSAGSKRFLHLVTADSSPWQEQTQSNRVHNVGLLTELQLLLFQSALMQIRIIVI